jgi:hypothetical protein
VVVGRNLLKKWLASFVLFFLLLLNKPGNWGRRGSNQADSGSFRVVVGDIGLDSVEAAGQADPVCTSSGALWLVDLLNCQLKVAASCNCMTTYLVAIVLLRRRMLRWIATIWRVRGWIALRRVAVVSGMRRPGGTTNVSFTGQAVSARSSGDKSLLILVIVALIRLLLVLVLLHGRLTTIRGHGWAAVAWVCRHFAVQVEIAIAITVTVTVTVTA